MGTKYRGTEKEIEALDAFIKLMRATEKVSAATQRHQAGAKLTNSQFGVLETLLHLGPMCQRDIGKKILKSSGNITTVIDNLEKRSLVERRRSSEDRRYIAIHLTDEGRELIEKIFPDHVEGIVKCFDVITAEERQELARICRKLGLGQPG